MRRRRSPAWLDTISWTGVEGMPDATKNKMTMEEMINVCVPYMATPESGMSEKDARDILDKSLPELKRWKKS